MSGFGVKYRCVQGCGRRVDCPGNVCDGCRRKIESGQRPTDHHRAIEGLGNVRPLTMTERAELGATLQDVPDPTTGLPLAEVGTREMREICVSQMCMLAVPISVVVEINGKGVRLVGVKMTDEQKVRLCEAAIKDVMSVRGVLMEDIERELQK